MAKVNRYGDVERVAQDTKTVDEILARQGAILVLDLIAAQAGDNAVKFKLTTIERKRLHTSLLDDLDNALGENLEALEGTP